MSNQLNSWIRHWRGILFYLPVQLLHEKSLQYSKKSRTVIPENPFLNRIGIFIGPSVFALIQLCTIFALVTCGPCATRDSLMPETNCKPGSLDYDACGSYGDNQDFFAAELSSSYVQESSTTLTGLGLDTLCTSSDFFCFPSTLPGILADEKNYKATQAKSFSQDSGASPEVSVPQHKWVSNSSWFSNHASFMLLNGKIILCSMTSGMKLHDASNQVKSADSSDCDSCGGPLDKHHRSSSMLGKKSELIESDLLDVSLVPNVEISPPNLDWGQIPLYFPSSTFLTVANTCNDSILHIYEPFSTDSQFYPCHSDEVFLHPGEVASICFVFLPRQLGVLSARVILQTSSGGFLIDAKGLGIESPYRIQPLVRKDNSSDGRWSNNLSLYNPFDDTLHIKEVTAWISVTSENSSQLVEAVCQIDNVQRFGGFVNGIDWLDMRTNEDHLPVMAIRPHESWEIDPHGAERVMEVNILSGAKGKLSGAFSVQLQSSSQDGTHTVVVPLEAEVLEKSDYTGFRGSVSVYLEPFLPCDGCETTSVVISLRTRANYLLKVTKVIEVTESTKLFHIKYMDGLLLLPYTVTPIAVVTYSFSPNDSTEPAPEVFKLHSNCKLLIQTNDSGSPPTEVSCQHVVQTCTKYRASSSIGQEHQHGRSSSSNGETGSVGATIQLPSRSQIELKTPEIAAADESVLRSWKLQGSKSSMSVLDDKEVLFPIVPIGSYCSKWITVRNPSEKPVVMQLILNSGAIVDQCKYINRFSQQSLPQSLVQNESTGPTGYGFSIAETAITEAYIHPHGKAVFGPIVFHPSDRCAWKSSALIRNNLSGIEWLQLQGFGGSLSLALLEESEPVQNLEFNLNMPIPLNISPQEMLFQMDDSSAACSVPLSKELYSKNTGDLLLEVRKIGVSGTDCGSAGFIVHNCKAFTLQPGESRRHLITYQSDFSIAMVQRDLELTLATGILVIPMKASLPVYMLGQCKKSFFWTVLKNLTLVVLISAFVIFLALFCVLPLVLPLGTQDFLFKTENGTISRIINPCVQCNQKSSKFATYNKVDGMIRSVREDETSKLDFVGRYCDCPSPTQEPRRADQCMQSVQDVEEQTLEVGAPKTETPTAPYSEAKSVLQESSLQAPQTDNLTVRVGKEKSKRRRKRRFAGGTGLTGLLEVASSLSGNSTPSSPMSPVTSFTTKRIRPVSPDGHVISSKNPFGKVASKNHVKDQTYEVVTPLTSLDHNVTGKYNNDGWSLSAQPKTRPPRNATSKPILTPSATCPSTSRCVPDDAQPSRSSASTSPPDTPPVTPHARAPGSNLCRQRSVRVENRASPEDRFTYDIWGNHFSGVDFVGRVKGVSTTMIPNASEEDSHSFFVMGPQILMQRSRARSVSPAPDLSSHAVTALSLKG